MHSEIESKSVPHRMELNLTNIKPQDSDRMITPSIFSPIIQGIDENPETVLKNDKLIMQDTISIGQFANPLSDIQSPLATRDRAHSFNDKTQNSHRKPLLFDKFEKVDDFGSDSQGLNDHLNHLCEDQPDDLLESWSPEGLA